ncbi:hypothetical protein M569_10080 [Genlisea aurea]|uniref:Pentatricopeptide repeat-containing protein n=1 Tax=Genlisea aurea TaxID=192259 RepID=S8DXL1_9LAMI|nr:hypothetical protein M569_10080 [Genlisea aurea]
MIENLKSAIAQLIHRNKSIKQLNQIYSHVTTSPILSSRDRSFLLSRLFLSICTLTHSPSLCYANKIFNRTPNPTIYMYNAMIRANATKTRHPDSCECFVLYKQMVGNGLVPDCVTFPFVLKECWRRFDLVAGRSLHDHLVKFGYETNVFVQNGLIRLYSECRVLEDAWKVFDEMSNRDVVSWNSIIAGYLRSGNLDSALGLFRRMNQRKNIITWNSVITGLVQCGRAKEALGFFHEMQVSENENNAVKPDKVTVASAISACASLGAIDQGKWMHSYLKRRGMECDLVMGTALVDMYGKCGFVEKAFQVFDGMKNKDVLSWTAMISAFALHGNGSKAFELFEQMEMAGVKPNAVTYVSALSACSHSGLVEKGRWYFDRMTRVHHIMPLLEHYACMISMFGRAGLFNEAEQFIRSMPIEPDIFIWGSLLGACQQHGNVTLGVKIAQRLIELEPHNHAFYIVLCDLYSKSERFDDQKRIRGLMEGQEIKKSVPGSSFMNFQ